MGGGTRISRDSKIIFVTGGSRSGKSSFAKSLAEAVGDKVFYVATAQPLDGEMRERIRKHKAERSDRWQTVEEPVDLVGALIRLKGEADAIVVDCMGLWISNLLTGGSDASKAVYLSEDEAQNLAMEVVSAAKSTGARVVFVSNEVGLGIVPEDALSRAFRDALGRVNQVLAQMSDEAYFLISGKAIPLKKPPSQLMPACDSEPSSGSAFASEAKCAAQKVQRRIDPELFQLRSYPWWHPLGPLYAFTFLTRIPLPRRLKTVDVTDIRPGQFRSAVVWFGAVGFLLGAVLAGSDYIMTVIVGIEAPVATAIQLALLFLLTGGLHVDGLADTADGFLSGRERSRILAIMKDSRVGSMGTSAVILVFILDYVLLAGTPIGLRTEALLTAPAVSRLAMVIAMYHAVHARAEGGLATPFLEASDLVSVVTGLLVTITLCSMTLGLSQSIVLCSVAAALARATTWYSTKRIGGITGDVLGAVNEITFPVSLLVIRVLNP